MKKRLGLKQVILETLSDACFCVKHLDSNEIQASSNTEIKNGSVRSEDDSVSEEKAVEGMRRIKVVITRKQLDRLLMTKQVSLEQLVFVNQRTFQRCFEDSKWIPKLDSIHESPEL